MTRTRHAEPGSRIVIDANLLGPCGFYCGTCLAYAKGVCRGCRYQADRNRSKGDPSFCPLLNCAERKGYTKCSDCNSFPCKRQYNPDKGGMYSWTYYDYLKKKIKPL